VSDAARDIAAHELQLARRSTELVYERMPELADAYGPAGRQKCEEDAAFHVRFLLAAVAVDDSSLFEDYARWTRDLLGRYGIPGSHVAASFRALGVALDELLPAAAEAARRHLEAGEAAVGD